MLPGSSVSWEPRAAGGSIELLHGPQRGQEGGEYRRDERQLEGGGSIAEVCRAALEGAGVAGTQQGARQGFATEVRVEAAADLQLEQPRGVELCEDPARKRQN